MEIKKASNEKIKFINTILFLELMDMEKYLDLFQANIEDLYSDDKKVINEILDKLAPYETQCKKILINELDIFKKIAFEFENKEAYFNELKRFNNDEIKNKIIENILIRNYESIRTDSVAENKKMKEEAKPNIKKYIDEKNWFTLVNDLKIEDSNKWHILQYLNNPSKLVDNYIELINEIEPVVNDYFPYFFEKFEKVFQYTKEELDLYLTLLNDVYDGLGIDFEKGFRENNVTTVIYVPIILSCFMFDISDENKGFLFIGYKFKNLLNFLKKKKEDEVLSRVNILKSLSDPSRYEILKLISQGEKTLKNIALKLNITSPTVSHHLTQMINGDLLNVNWKNSDNPINITKLKSLFNKILEELNTKDD